MTVFVVLAALLTLGVIALVAAPLLRGTREPRALGAAVAVCAVLGIGAALLYGSWSNWSWAGATVDSPEAMVGRLARRLERNPDDLDGWLMLGRSHAALGQLPLAARAYQRADRVAAGRSAEALVGLAEVLALMDDAQLDGRAGRLLEQALALEPRNPRALFYGAASALRRGELPLARERFAALLALDPPQSVRGVLEQQIAALDAQIAAGAGDAAPAEPAAPPATVRVNVALAPQLLAQVPQTAPLFVIIRDPDRPGPPLAVKRLESRLPQSIELTPEDAMIAGSGFTHGQQVQVVARIARSGSAIARSGDPFGEVRYHVGRDGLVDLVIDRLTP